MVPTCTFVSEKSPSTLEIYFPPSISFLSLIDHGHQPVPHFDFILGHELVGEISEVGSAVKEFKKGDLVVSPFTVSW